MKFETIHSRTSTITIPRPENYTDCWELIRSDFYRHTGNRGTVGQILWRVVRSGQFAFQFWLRLASVRGGGYYLAKFFHHWLSTKYCLQIYPGQKIGYGLCLSHGVNIIVNPATVIGNNVNLSQFINIGTTKDSAAVIADGTTIFPMACIVNDVHIGREVTVGAGAVVTKDAPAQSTVAGVPARVLGYKCPGHFVGNRYPLPAECRGE